MIDALSNLRVHPIQYLLVGAAMSMFFLLLVSLSEHLPFETAYALAASSCARSCRHCASTPGSSSGGRL